MPHTGREELVRGRDLVADRGDVVPAAASAEEAEGLLAGRCSAAAARSGAAAAPPPTRAARGARAGGAAGARRDLLEQLLDVAVAGLASISSRSAAPELAM